MIMIISMMVFLLSSLVWLSIFDLTSMAISGKPLKRRQHQLATPQVWPMQKPRKCIIMTLASFALQLPRRQRGVHAPPVPGRARACDEPSAMLALNPPNGLVSRGVVLLRDLSGPCWGAETSPEPSLLRGLGYWQSLINGTSQRSLYDLQPWNLTPTRKKSRRKSLYPHNSIIKHVHN